MKWKLVGKVSVAFLLLALLGILLVGKQKGLQVARHDPARVAFGLAVWWLATAGVSRVLSSSTDPSNGNTAWPPSPIQELVAFGWASAATPKRSPATFSKRPGTQPSPQSPSFPFRTKQEQNAREPIGKGEGWLY